VPFFTRTFLNKCWSRTSDIVHDLRNSDIRGPTFGCNFILHQSNWKQLEVTDTRTAFLTSLSANLQIDPDLPSPLATPLFRSSNHHYPLPPPSPLSFSTAAAHTSYLSLSEADIMSLNTPAQEAPKSPTDGLPELNTLTAETEEDREDGLRLVADSVAQQRQLASKILIFHPVNLAAFFAVLAIVTQYIWTWKHDLLFVGTTLGGLVMMALVAVRSAVGGYLTCAEEINWDWLGEDRLLIVKWGEEVIGALVLGWADNSESAKKRGTRRKRGQAIVRGWSVRLRYRGKGIGESLLEEAVKIAGEKGADGIVFDRNHASKLPSPHISTRPETNSYSLQAHPSQFL
jgi:GNAT superfamily N-acetyltransferase